MRFISVYGELRTVASRLGSLADKQRAGTGGQAPANGARGSQLTTGSPARPRFLKAFIVFRSSPLTWPGQAPVRALLLVLIAVGAFGLAPRLLPIQGQKQKAMTALSIYNAISDLFPRRKPPLPRLGPAGTFIVDPTFGTRILRVTDADTSRLGPEIANSFSGPSGGLEFNWNADSTMFWVGDLGGSVLLYSFDPVNFTVRPVSDPANPGQILTVEMGEPWFSSQDPNFLYGVAGERGHTITRYDIAKHSYTPLFDLEKVVPLTSEQYSSLLSVDQTDTFFSVAFGGMQDTHTYLIVWNRKTGGYTFLDTKKSTVKLYGSATAQRTNLRLGFGIHASVIDRTGRYVNLGSVNIFSSQEPEGDYIWDTQTGQLKVLAVDSSGHNVQGFGNLINQSGFAVPDIGTDDGQGYSIRSLDPVGLDHPALLTPTFPPPYRWSYDSHPSWNNARPDILVPFAAALYGIPDPESPLRAWEDEIIAVATDGTQKVWRFAHHRSHVESVEFDNAVPRGNISQDGKYFLFTSNWEGSLGTDPSTGQARTDVFIVELDQKFPAL